jgi:HSP20 family protein
MMSLRDAMDRLLEESLVRPLGFPGETDQIPAIDLVEKEDVYVVKAAVPGVHSDDLEITTTGNTLIIKGETREEKEEEEEGRYIYRERSYGAFSRSITLPEDINADEAEAEFEDGILKLTLPKAESAKRKSIKIQKK